MANQIGPQPNWYNESGILTIPITKSAPVNPADWFKSRYWPMVTLVGGGLLLVGLVKRNRRK